MSIGYYISSFPDDSGNRVYLEDCGCKITGGLSITGGINTETFDGYGRNSFVVTSQRVGMQSIEMPVTYKSVRASDEIGARNEIYTNMNIVERAMLGKFVLNILDGFLYHCVLLDKGTEKWIGSYMCERTYRLSGVRTGEAITESFAFDGPITVNCDSTVPKTDCRILLKNAPEILQQRSVGQLTVGDLTYKVKDGLIFKWSGELLVDGIDKVITAQGDNAVSKFDWVDFPYLVPGENTISLDDASYDNKFYCYVTYYPTYL